MKLTKGKIIAIAAVLCILAAAFFLPGGAPGGADAPQTSAPGETVNVGSDAPVSQLPAESAAPSMEPPAELPESVPPAETPEVSPAETEPAPSAPLQSPAPEAPAETGAEPAPEPVSETLTCTLSISCATILDNLDRLTPGKEGLIPADGWLLPAVEAEFEPGESVFDVLKRELQRRNMHFEYSSSALYDTAYIEGICNLYEYDCGELSGWKYAVNGVFPSYGCSQYTLSGGDAVTWVYTCDLGADVGDGS